MALRFGVQVETWPKITADEIKAWKEQRVIKHFFFGSSCSSTTGPRILSAGRDFGKRETGKSSLQVFPCDDITACRMNSVWHLRPVSRVISRIWSCSCIVKSAFHDSHSTGNIRWSIWSRDTYIILVRSLNTSLVERKKTTVTPLSPLHQVTWIQNLTKLNLHTCLHERIQSILTFSFTQPPGSSATSPHTH